MACHFGLRGIILGNTIYNNVVGVRFRHGSRMYYFDPGVLPVVNGTFVVVDTAGGPEYGLAVTDVRAAAQDDIVEPLKAVIRIATEEDKKAFNDNLELETEATLGCIEKVKEHELDMKVIGTEYNLDRSKATFFFTSDGRVDFRDLVKDLASMFHTRIELRQVGVRDEARMDNGIGICGRAYCCATFLTDFATVGVKMAKNQNISLNQNKITGSCGRLMCCLKYEDDTYTELNRVTPSEGDLVETPDGTGEVLHANVLRQKVKVGVRKSNGINPDKDDILIKEYEVENVKILNRRHKKNDTENVDLTDEK